MRQIRGASPVVRAFWLGYALAALTVLIMAYQARLVRESEEKHDDAAHTA